MKKLKSPAGPGMASIITNDEKIAEFRDFREEAANHIRRQIILGRRIPQILEDVGNELVVATRWGPDPVPKLEALMRVVYEMALDGNLWCINFIADRTEGRPTQSVVVNQIHGDIRDVPTSELMASRDAEALDKLVEARARAMIASGEFKPDAE